MVGGKIELGGGRNLGKIDQIVKLFYFSANLQNDIKSFDPSIDHPIAEVLQEGICINRKIDATYIYNILGRTSQNAACWNQ